MKRTLGVAAALAVLALAGCGSNAPDPDRISGQTLTIYASVPLHGASRVNASAVLAGERLALAQAHGKVGKYRIAFHALDDSTAARDSWDPAQTTLNAHLAAQDRTTVGYLGEFNSGASAVSIPLLNRDGIAQISPASTAVGLTSAGLGAFPGEPEKYYPTGKRTFARVVPNDAVQARAQLELQKAAGCRKTYVLDDGEVDGQDTAESFLAAAQKGGLTIAGNQAYDPTVTDYRSLAITVAQSGADCVLISAITERHAALVTRQVAAAMPAAKLFATAGVAESTFTNPAEGGVPAELDSRLTITVATLDPSSYPASARAFYAAYARRYGASQPYAIFGYEAMSLMLNAIARATGDGTKAARRSKVVAALLATRNHSSVLGTYSIDANGDTTLRSYGAYRINNGQLSFWRALGT